MNADMLTLSCYRYQSDIIYERTTPYFPILHIPYFAGGTELRILPHGEDPKLGLKKKKDLQDLRGE